MARYDYFSLPIDIGCHLLTNACSLAAFLYPSRFIWCALLWANWTKKLGYGDTFVILVLGITLGDQTLASILFIASLTALIYAKYTKQHAFPFVPFLSVGYLLSLPIALNWAKF
ncbi:hypothetical protein [Ligilactobacillus animalis]|uniref:hypothetical protein n=1 Tax=Ligilactobacillus animalis TaxID=1605 RepID=UPI0026DF9D67|nr:hypothetical protein [Ligilactobacillus animalis]MDO5883059.1 hypothetical protein [Ligilactobacillus animalis]